MNISYRSSRSGKWLVCAAIPVRNIGESVVVRASDEPLRGYTTGHIYASGLETEQQAREFATDLCAESGYNLVEWVNPEKRLTYIELEKMYPTAKNFSSLKEAVEAGWLFIPANKTVHTHRRIRIKCIDTSPPRSFGYNYSIFVFRGIGKVEILKSVDVTYDADTSTGYKISAMFSTGELVDAIEAAIAEIDESLITQAEAARIYGKITGRAPLVQTVNQAILRGNLAGYQGDSGYKRQGNTLVDRLEVEAWAKRRARD